MEQKRQKRGNWLLLGMILCCVMIVMLMSYAQMLQRQLKTGIINQLQEVSEQSVVVLRGKIEEKFVLLEEIAHRFSEAEEFHVMEAVGDLKTIAERHSFKRMGIIVPIGTAYTTDDKILNASDSDFFKESMQGKSAVSDLLEDRISGGGNIIVFSVPIFKGENVCAVLFAAYHVEEIQELLSVSMFGGEGYSYVIKENGDAVIDSTSPNGFRNFQNIYRSLAETSDTNEKPAQMLREALEKEESGYIVFHNQVDKYMYYAPLGVRDWYILNVVPTGVMDSSRDDIMLMTRRLCIILMVLFLILLMNMIRIERQKKKELSDILYVDSVTGGYSFARFCTEAPKLVQETERNTAYIFMDIDNFKVINELFGYMEGDRTLRYIWKVWKKCSREDEIFARRIADRYTVLWHFETRKELDDRVKNLVKDLQSELPENADYNLKVTMGIYIVQDKQENVQNTINYAMIAHSAAKEQAGVWYVYYDDEFRERLLRNKRLEAQMKMALESNEFQVYYQPKYSVDTRELVGAEALVRWRKKDGSMIMPDRFIPFAEKTGFIRQLDKYIFKKVCQKQHDWMEDGMELVPVSVNLSRHHLYNDDFMEEYRTIVDEADVPVKYLQLELTESAIFENQESLCNIIDRLHTLGFRVQMDDFGTGYSSLMMLKSVPIDTLKLDKSFVDDFDDKKGEKIIVSVIRLAQSLQIEVTAEGVETEEQYTFLKKLGCDIIQGFYFAKPMPEEEFTKLLKKKGTAYREQVMA